MSGACIEWTDVCFSDQSDWSFYEQTIQLPLARVATSAKYCFGDIEEKPSCGGMIFSREKVFSNEDFYCEYCGYAERKH